MYLLYRVGEEFRHHKFNDDNLPEYAILSHTWGSDEVTFKDIRKNRARSRAEFRKVKFCMDRASTDGFEYCWVDTCCIDEANNNEVSEAINSMFRWYQHAAKCYVYLSDVPQESFQSSRWFTRGWTLQELLAPETVEFFASDGAFLGDKISRLQDIHSRTQIPITALQGHDLGQFSVKERLGWIEQRQTTRGEDMIYSLLGIFGVSMPLVYGEGRQRARLRLLEQIDKDYTLPGIAHRVENLNNVGEVSKTRQMSPLPSCSQQASGRTLTTLTRAQYLISRPRYQETSTTDNWTSVVECETGAKRSRVQDIASQRKVNTSNLKSKIECEVCEKRFCNQVAASQHMDATNHRKPKFECNVCEKRFTSQTAASQHMDATNHRKPKFECNACEKRFTSQTAANQHMDAANHRKPEFKCDTCEKRFSSETAANQHMDATSH